MEPVTMSLVAGAVIEAIVWGINLFMDIAAQFQGANTRSKLTKIAQHIYNQIGDNTQLLNDITTAYNNKDASYMTALLSGSGFGPRSAYIKSQRKAILDDYTNRSGKLNKKITQLQADHNTVVNASSHTGTFGGNESGEDVVRQMNKKYDLNGSDPQGKSVEETQNALVKGGAK